MIRTLALAFAVLAPATSSRAADLQARADSLEQEVRALVEQGALEPALRAAEEVVRLREAGLPANDPRVARAYHELGYRRYFLEDFAAAAAALEAALASLEAAEPRDVEAVVWCRSDLAEMHRLLGDYARAEAELTAAVETARAELPENALLAVLLNNLAGIAWDQDRLADTERLLREALRVSEADPEASPLRIANAVGNLGVVCRSQRKWEDAEALLLRALALARAAVPPGDPELLYFLKEPAVLLSARGRFDEAIPFREEALAILEKLETPQNVFRAEILQEIARDYAQQGKLDAAARRYERSLHVGEGVLGAGHPTVGALLAEWAEVDTRRFGFEDRRADPRLDRALRILEATPAASEARALARATHARRLHARGFGADARRFMAKAIEDIETLRPLQGASDLARTRFLGEHLAYYDDAIAWAVDAFDAEDALRQAERLHARVLMDELAASDAEWRRGVPGLEALEARERAARIRVSQARAALQAAAGDWQAEDAARAEAIGRLESDLQGAARELQAVLDEIRLASPGWQAAIAASREDIDVRALQENVLGPREGVLLYRVGERRSFAFLVPPRGDVMAAELKGPGGAVGRQALERLLFPEGPGSLAVLRERPGRARGVTGAVPLGAPAGDAVIGTLHLLWRILLPPALSHRLLRLDEVILVADGVLHALPFDALVVETDPLSYWLDEGPVIRHSPSLTVFASARGRSATPPADGRIVSVCDPAFPEAAGAGAPRSRVGERLVRLPGTRAEADAVVAAFPGRKVTVLAGKDAREDRFKATAPSGAIVHVATHGLVDRAGSELLAALAFTPPPAGDVEDGFLHLFEIRELRLNCDLAILSACDTNAGPIVEGEGVFAMSREFLAAGARNVVAALWRLDDEAAAELVGAFARAAAADDAPGPRADYARTLREAKRRLRSEAAWSDPHFWAPFVLTGVR